MNQTGRIAAALLCAAVLAAAAAAAPQAGQNTIEGIVRLTTGKPVMVRVRIFLQSGMRLVSETFTSADGRFRFDGLQPAEYILETEETGEYHGSRLNHIVRQFIEESGTSTRVTLTVTPKASAIPATGVIAADIDLDVSEAARKRFDAGTAAARAGDSKRAVDEYREAIKAHPEYFAARLALGRELRKKGKFTEALEALEPLPRIGPKHAEPRIEMGVVLMGLGKRQEAANVLREALALDEASWSAHLFLGYALLDVNDEEAEPHFWRALKLNPKEAVKAHLALARLADRYGYVKEAIEQLDLYLAAASDAPDAAEVRKLAERLRKKLPRP